jgi:hypothetical protein
MLTTVASKKLKVSIITDSSLPKWTFKTPGICRRAHAHTYTQSKRSVLRVNQTQLKKTLQTKINGSNRSVTCVTSCLRHRGGRDQYTRRSGSHLFVTWSRYSRQRAACYIAQIRCVRWVVIKYWGQSRRKRVNGENCVMRIFLSKYYLGWAGHVICVGKKRNLYGNFVDKPG